MMTKECKIIYCALLAASEPVSVDKLLQLFLLDEAMVMDRENLLNKLTELQEICTSQGLILKETASGYSLQIDPELQPWISRLWDKRPPRYSRALLETLALIAYRQPMTRAEIEEIRGVSIASSVFKTLTEREWVRVVGHRDVPGKPALYATTRQFLDYFNLKTLAELPPLTEMANTLEAVNEEISPEITEEITA